MESIDQSKKVKRFSNIDKDKCILIVFLNEFDGNGKEIIGLGFTNWLEEKEESDVTLLNIHIGDDSQHLINWPENYEVTTVTKNTRTQLQKCQFKLHAVKILAYGSWSEMKAKEQNLQNFDQVATPTKKGRHDLKRKEFDDDFLIPDLTKNNKKDAPSNSGGGCKKKIKSHSEDSQLKDEIEKIVEKPLYTDSEEEFDNDEFEEELEAKDRLIIEKEKKIEMLKNLMESEKKNNETKLNSLIFENNELKAKIESLERKADVLKTEITFQYQELMEASKNDFQKIANITQKRLQSFCRKTLNEVTNSDTSVKPEQVDSNDESDIENEKPIKEKKVLRHNYFNPHKMRSRALLPTKFIIPKDVEESVARKKVKDAANYLLKKYFTTGELAESSCTGIASNANTEIPAKALDIERFNAIRNVLFKHHEGKTRQWVTIFMNAGRNLIGTCRKK